MIETALRDLIREAVADALDDRLGDLLSRAAPTSRCSEFLTTEEAAEVARVKPDTIRDWVRAGHLSRLGTARHLLVRRAQLEEFLTCSSGDGGPTDSDLDVIAAAVLNRKSR